MQFSKSTILSTISLLSSIVTAEEDVTTTSTVFITKTSTLGHGHVSATTEAFTTTETFVSSSSTASVLSAASAVAFDFSNSTNGYNDTSYASSNVSSNTSAPVNSTATNVTYLARREALPSEIAPVITYSAFGNKIGAATGASVGALAIVAGLLL